MTKPNIPNRIRNNFEEMEKIISTLGSEISLNYNNGSPLTLHAISETTLTISAMLRPDSYKKIKHFYKLNRLSLIGLDGTHGPQTSITNASVKIITITNCAAFTNFECIKNFPNLEEFTMANCTLSTNAENTLKTTKHNIIQIKERIIQKYCATQKKYKQDHMLFVNAHIEFPTTTELSKIDFVNRRD
jgi:hypothetical protein